MKILYDISRLGECQHQPAARTGIFRVIENVAAGLLRSPECDLAFTAGESFDALEGAIEYLQVEPRFNKVPFLVPDNWQTKQRQARRLREINAELNGSSFSELMNSSRPTAGLIRRLKLSHRAERRWLAQIRGVREAQRPFDAGWPSRADIFHSPFHPLPNAANAAMRFLTVYDLIPILFPQFCVESQIQFADQLLKSIRPTDFVLCISKATRNDLCNALKIDPGNVQVTYLAADPMLFYPVTDARAKKSIHLRYNIPDGPYVLSLNTIEPRKNIEQIVKCFAKVVEEQRIRDLNLVLVGARGWLSDDIMRTISSYGSVQNRIVFTGYVADDDLAALYSGALAFLFLSHYEGFGLPALEAMQCGVPVIASNVSSLPEVVDDAGILCDPSDTDAGCQALLDLYTSSALRTTMAEKSVARAGEFTWEKCIQQTVSAYQRAL